MIHLYSYLIIGMFITFSTAATLKNRFGSLEYVVELMRFADKDFDESCEGFTNEQLVGMILVIGMLLSPFIALYIYIYYLFTGGIKWPEVRKQNSKDYVQQSTNMIIVGWMAKLLLKVATLSMAYGFMPSLYSNFSVG